MEEPAGSTHMTEPAGYTHEDGEPMVASTAFVYTRKPTSSFLLFLNGEPTIIEAKTKILTV